MRDSAACSAYVIDETAIKSIAPKELVNFKDTLEKVGITFDDFCSEVSYQDNLNDIEFFF